MSGIYCFREFLDSRTVIDPDSQCWNYTGPYNHHGYGDVDRIIDGKRYKHAHRLSYVRHFGSIPEGKIVLHHCDNRKCINPDHLYAGTHADNVRDMVHRDRFHSKLSRVEVMIIRDLHAIGMTLYWLNVLFPVSEVTILSIIRRKSWAFV